MNPFKWWLKRVQAHNRPLVRRASLALLALTSGFAFLAMLAQSGCRAHAVTSADYCWGQQITITNTSGAALTNYLVALTINTDVAIAAAYMQPQAWDLYLTDSSGDDIEFFAQDAGENDARFWILVPSLADGATETYTLNLGSSGVRRNNGFAFNGAATITRTHAAAFNVTNNLGVKVIAQSDVSHATAGWFLSHWTANTGYRLGVITISGTTYVRAQVDSATLDVAWTGSNTTIDMTFKSGTLEILFDGVSQGTSTTGLGAISTNSEDLVAGSGYTGVLRYVQLQSNVVAAPTVVLTWGIWATSAVELTAVAPTYTGTIPDDNATYNGTYSITSAQTGILVTPGYVYSNYTDAALTIPQRLGINIFGDAPSDSTLSPTGTGASFPGGGRINQIADDIGFPRQAAWLMLVAGICILVMFLIGTFTGEAIAALAVPIVPIAIFGVVGPIGVWVAFVYGAAGIGIYGITRPA